MRIKGNKKPWSLCWIEGTHRVNKSTFLQIYIFNKYFSFLFSAYSEFYHECCLTCMPNFSFCVPSGIAWKTGRWTACQPCSPSRNGETVCLFEHPQPVVPKFGPVNLSLAGAGIGPMALKERVVVIWSHARLLCRPTCCYFANTTRLGRESRTNPFSSSSHLLSWSATKPCVSGIAAGANSPLPGTPPGFQDAVLSIKSGTSRSAWVRATSFPL